MIVKAHPAPSDSQNPAPRFSIQGMTRNIGWLSAARMRYLEDTASSSATAGLLLTRKLRHRRRGTFASPM
ncbi:MAG: hypothetical protein RIQ93_2888, partial [Verrucomicrobiota bacterium]